MCVQYILQKRSKIYRNIIPATCHAPRAVRREHRAEKARVPVPDQLRQDTTGADAARGEHVREGRQRPQPSHPRARRANHGMHPGREDHRIPLRAPPKGSPGRSKQWNRERNANLHVETRTTVTVVFNFLTHAAAPPSPSHTRSLLYSSVASIRRGGGGGATSCPRVFLFGPSRTS